ncbi:hypothetical protein QM435_11920 [Legionella pneumophila]|nr:hypothetical protein [Legionella pneumophila]MDI9845861.1 hypothetical protein [Legionella pneumophila]HAW6248200.1 hypothetical protein [Legionella pneumophila]
MENDQRLKLLRDLQKIEDKDLDKIIHAVYEDFIAQSDSLLKNCIKRKWWHAINAYNDQRFDLCRSKLEGALECKDNITSTNPTNSIKDKINSEAASIKPEQMSNALKEMETK